MNVIKPVTADDVAHQVVADMFQWDHQISLEDAAILVRCKQMGSQLFSLWKLLSSSLLHCLKSIF